MAAQLTWRACVTGPAKVPGAKISVLSPASTTKTDDKVEMQNIAMDQGPRPISCAQWLFFEKEGLTATLRSMLPPRPNLNPQAQAATVVAL